MKRLLILSLFACISSAVFSQQNKLQVGDTLPNCIPTNVLNYPGKNMTLPLSSGKWLLLDFWSTNCSGCVASLPKIQRFRERFSDRIEWYLVSYQSKEQISQFLKKRKQLTGSDTSIPIICGDSLLTKYFKPDGFPHWVWIDSLGIIRSVTGEMEITEANIQEVLSNKNYHMEQKDDLTIMYSDTPLYNAGKYVDSSKLIWTTTLSRYTPIFYWESGFSVADAKSCISAYNASIKRLCQIAFNDDKGQGDFYYLPESRTELLVKDTAKYVFFVDGKIKYDNLYSYQAILPKMSVPDLKYIMQNDLKKYFNIDAKMEKKYRLCWVLSAKDTLSFKSKGGLQSQQWDGVNFRRIMHNCQFDDFRIYMEHIFLQFSPFPFVNEIHTNENIDLMLENLKLNDPESMKRELRKYGISMNLENRLIDVLVIDERPKIGN